MNSVNSTLAKIVLGNIFRTLLTALATFFVTKGVIEADVASKLARGDTIPLWDGSLSINLAMVTNVLVGLALPIILPLAWGIWSRLVSAYETIVARCNDFSMTKTALKDKTQDSSVAQIIKTVANEAPASK